MTINQIVFIVLALFFSVIIILNTIKKRIFEKDSLIWLFLMIIVLLFGIFPSIIDTISGWFGIDYPPSLLFLLSILSLLYLVFRLTTQVTVLNMRVKELGQQIAILKERIKSNKESPDI
jgi:hypothetical protein